MRTRVRPALPAIGLAHLIKTAFAFALLGPLGSALAAAAELSTAQSDAAEVLVLVWRALQGWTAGAQWLGLLYLLLAPLLTQLVLAALARAGWLRAERRWGRARFARALGLTLLHALALAALLVLGYRAAAALPALVPPSAALEDSVLAGCLVLCALGALWLGTALDLAHARVALEHPQSAALRAGLRATSLRACAFHLACIAAALGVTLASDLLARGLPWPALAIALQQTLALASTLVRARWLARSVDLMNSPNEPARIN
jgi:hypothetical protein